MYTEIKFIVIFGAVNSFLSTLSSALRRTSSHANTSIGSMLSIIHTVSFQVGFFQQEPSEVTVFIRSYFKSLDFGHHIQFCEFGKST